MTGGQQELVRVIKAGGQRGASIEEIAAALWPVARLRPENWKKSLRVRVNRLRDMGQPVETVDGGYRLVATELVDAGRRHFPEIDDATIRALAGIGCGPAAIAKAVNRSVNSIIGRAYRLGISLPTVSRQIPMPLQEKYAAHAAAVRMRAVASPGNPAAGSAQAGGGDPCTLAGHPSPFCAGAVHEHSMEDTAP